jgi:arylsulfatase A-like enzyme
VDTWTRRHLLKRLALLPFLPVGLPASRPWRARSRADRRPPNLLLLVFDAFSAHHAQLYGYPLPTTPRLRRFADRATLFHSHYSAGSFTTPGTASLLTGTYPWSHRAVNLQGTVLDQFRDRNLFRMLGDQGYYRLAFSHNLVVLSLLDQFRRDIDAVTLTRELCLQDPYVSELLFGRDFTPAVQAESLLRRRGSSSSSLFLYEAYRLWMTYLDRRRYVQHADRFPRGLPVLQDQVFLLEDAIDWTIGRLQAMPQPFFAYLHFLPPHDPYNARMDFVGRFAGPRPAPAKPIHAFATGETPEWIANASREYDEYIGYADAELGRLLDFMDAHGFLDTTHVIVTSDHGELFERGIWGHLSQALFEPLIRVPLVVSSPGQRTPRDVHRTTSSVDVLPTLLQLAGIPQPDWCEGEPLPLGADEASPSDRAVYAMDAKGSSKFGPLRKRTVSVIRDRRKLIHYLGYDEYDDVYELYDLRDDPHELRNLYSPGRGPASDLKALLQAQLRHLDARA